jgi:hypothetical protein
MVTCDFSISCHFNTTEVIEAKLQAVLTTLREHDFQDKFKKWWKHWEWCIYAEGEYFKGDGRLKVSFD